MSRPRRCAFEDDGRLGQFQSRSCRGVTGSGKTRKSACAWPRRFARSGRSCSCSSKSALTPAVSCQFRQRFGRARGRSAQPVSSDGETSRSMAAHPSRASVDVVDRHPVGDLRAARSGGADRRGRGARRLYQAGGESSRYSATTSADRSRAARKRAGRASASATPSMEAITTPMTGKYERIVLDAACSDRRRS